MLGSKLRLIRSFIRIRLSEPLQHAAKLSAVVFTYHKSVTPSGPASAERLSTVSHLATPLSVSMAGLPTVAPAGGCARKARGKTANRRRRRNPFFPPPRYPLSPPTEKFMPQLIFNLGAYLLCKIPNCVPKCPE